MPPKTIAPLVKQPSGTGRPELARRFPGKYLSLSSFRRDGSAVATPVWFVIEKDRLLVKTDEQSFKVKRILRNPAVLIGPCSASGRLRGEPEPAQAKLLPQDQRADVDQLMADKYRIDRILILPLYRAVQRLRGAPARTGEVVLAITPTSAASGSDRPEDPS
jgi:PPOX class probable F420-dependent enzyme